MRIAALVTIWFCFCAGGALRAGDALPRWLATAAQYQPSSDSAAPAVVLWDEADVTVDASGKITKAERWAIQILKPEGRKEAVAAKHYAPDTDKVHELRGWIIAPSGQARALGKEHLTDMEAGESLYQEDRIRTLSAIQECGQGWIFGYEALLEERSIFTQMEWHFQQQLPVVLSRYTLHLPETWELSAQMLNHEGIKPTIIRNTWSWEMRDLPFLETEPGGPQVSALAPRLAISLFPGGRTSLGQTFANWQDVSGYASGLFDPQGQPDAAITARVQQLIAGKTTEMERILAIAAFVQNLRYVSIQVQLGHGGGQRPHPASVVFAKGYGDCKDKATLMRAMLRAAAINSYPVLIYYGDPNYVHEQWPSPYQFNHCILAIRVSDAVSGYAVVQAPRLGRLLIFDSTDPHTPAGELPEDEQNSMALIVASDKGALIRIPVAAADANRMERLTQLAVEADGSLQGSAEVRFSGGLAVRARSQYRERGELAKTIERSMARQLPGLAMSSVQPSDTFFENSFRLDMQFRVPYYAQRLQDRLLVFRPAALPRPEFVPASDGQRKYPMEVKSAIFRETVRVKVPDHFAIDELPDPANIQTDFGIFATTCAAKDGEITYTRSLQTNATIIPAENYGEVKKFFRRVADAEIQPVVLVKE